MNHQFNSIRCTYIYNKLTFLVFGIFNILAMPVIRLIYPEVAGKTLEEVNRLFASNSIFAFENAKEYQRMLDDAGGNLTLASLWRVLRLSSPRVRR
jgi:hypothetical protein